MKIIVIGDIHGLDTWKKIVATHSFDLCVFVGDYFDSFDIGANKQIKNFKEIVKFKKANPDKVVMLMGNHDFHYIYPGETYSGYNHLKATDIADEISYAYRFIKKVHVADGFLFSHAGVTMTWLQNHNVDTLNIEKSINELSNTHFAFYPEDTSHCGEHIAQGPLWVRPESLLDDGYGYYHQIVGHTKQKTVKMYKNITLIDTLWTNEFIIINDGVISVETV